MPFRTKQEKLQELSKIYNLFVSKDQQLANIILNKMVEYLKEHYTHTDFKEKNSPLSRLFRK